MDRLNDAASNDTGLEHGFPAELLLDVPAAYQLTPTSNLAELADWSVRSYLPYNKR